MKNYVLRVLLFIFVSVILLIMINAVGEHLIEPERIMAYDNLTFEEIPETIKYMNFGNSHGQRTFKYSVMGEDVYGESFNFGLTAQSLVYDNILASFYEGHFNAEDGVVFLPISYFSLYSDEMAEEGAEQKHYRYYPYLDKEHMRKWNAKDAFLYGKLYYHLPILRYADKQIGSILYLKEEWTEKDSKKVEENTAGMLKENKEALENMINLFQSHGYRVILLTSPVQNEFIMEWGDEYIKQYYKDIKIFVEQFNVEYWDFSNLFNDRSELFIDSHHLSEEGAEIFTKMIFEKILQ